MRRMHFPARAFLLCAVVVWIPSFARAERAPLLQVAAYDIAVVDRAVETQAWVILQAAAAHAEQNGGRYPERVSEFAHRLPRQALMSNVWTGEINVPSDTTESTAGEIEYRPVYAHGHSVGCRVVATGRYGARIVLVSDLTWWRNQQEPLQLGARR
jgi:hypothetical protein